MLGLISIFRDTTVAETTDGEKSVVCVCMCWIYNVQVDLHAIHPREMRGNVCASPLYRVRVILANKLLHNFAVRIYRSAAIRLADHVLHI